MLEFHPLADEFPLIEGEAFDALVASIKRDGQFEPIMMCDGKILDGRNRYRACIAAGVEPVFEMFDDTDPSAWVKYVAAKNLTRRHLADGQRALIAARMTMLSGMNGDQAAQAMNVKRRSAQKASVVYRHGSQNVVDLVASGAVSVHKAHKVVSGLAPESILDEDLRRTRGRRPGDSHLNKLRNILTECEGIYDYGDKIANHWPGDPRLNIQLARAHKFLGDMLTRTREADHAAAVA
jgi:ParB-like nuclease domain